MNKDTSMFMDGVYGVVMKKLEWKDEHFRKSVLSYYPREVVGITATIAQEPVRPVFAAHIHNGVLREWMGYGMNVSVPDEVEIKTIALDDDFVKAVRAAISDTWSQIASDLYNGLEKRYRKPLVYMEATIDADRLHTFGHPVENWMIGQACRMFDYETVL